MSDDTQRLAANKQLIQDYFREVVAAFDVTAVRRFVADDFVLHGADALVGLPAFEAILKRDFGDHPPLDAATVPVLPATFTIAEGDLVTICFYMPAAEPGQPGKTYDLFAYNTYRIRDGKIVERWTNEHKYARPQLPEDPTTGGNRATAPRHVGETDLAANKQLVAAFYDRVFGRMDPAAVQDFVAEDYFQHASHMPQGRHGLQAYVAELAKRLPPPLAGAGAAAGAPRLSPSLPPPSVLHAEGDMVVIAARVPQPLRDGSGGTWDYFAYDAYRVLDGKLSEHWSGIDKHAPPQMP